MVPCAVRRIEPLNTKPLRLQFEKVTSNWSPAAYPTLEADLVTEEVNVPPPVHASSPGNVEPPPTVDVPLSKESPNAITVLASESAPNKVSAPKLAVVWMSDWVKRVVPALAGAGALSPPPPQAANKKVLASKTGKKFRCFKK